MSKKHKSNTPKAEAPAPKVRCEVKAEVSHNPSLLEWPTDIWGLTKDIKKDFVALASRVKGQADKKELVERTLKVALAHLEARFSHDAKNRAAVIKANEDTKEPVRF